MEMMRRTLERVLEAWRNSKGAQVKLESKANSISSPFQSPGEGRTKIDNQVTSEIRFGRSTYAQKAKRIYFSMEPISCQNLSGVNGNH
jgi:hypothetical protein